MSLLNLTPPSAALRAPITPLRCLCGAPLPPSPDREEAYYCSTRCARFDAMHALLGNDATHSPSSSSLSSDKAIQRNSMPRTISQMYPGGLALNFGNDLSEDADSDDAADSELRQGLAFLHLGRHGSHYRMCQASSSLLPAIELEESDDDDDMSDSDDDRRLSASFSAASSLSGAAADDEDSRSSLALPPAPSLKSSRDLALREELAALDAELTRTLLEVQGSPHWTYEDPLGFDGSATNLLGLDLGGVALGTAKLDEHTPRFSSPSPELEGSAFVAPPTPEVQRKHSPVVWNAAFTGASEQGVAPFGGASLANSRGRSNSTPNLACGEFEFHAPRPAPAVLTAPSTNGHFVGRIRNKLAALGRRPSAGV